MRRDTRKDMKEPEKSLAQAKQHLPKWRATMNLATKTMPWMVASLLTATPFFGQNQSGGNCPQPCKPVKCCTTQVPQQPTTCAYNAPAEINVGCQGDVDVFLSGSFIYWQPILDNGNVALVNDNTRAQFTNAAPFKFAGNFVEMNFQYKPGFKVGAGVNLQTDDWDGYAEYTRVHGSHNVASNGGYIGTSPPNVYPTWGSPFLVSQGSQVYNRVAATFDNNLDFIDAEMGRKYYVGRNLVFRSAFGARGAWIIQSMVVDYTNSQSAVSASASGNSFQQSVPGVFHVVSESHSWGIGPRMGLTMDWNLGEGFRFIGSGYTDILYTKYVLQDKSRFTATITNSPFTADQPVDFLAKDTVKAVRAHLDLEMGLGWGTYFDNNNWHFDLLATYGYQVFFQQNMFHHYNDDQMLGNSTAPNGDLTVNGLTVTARFDF